MTQLGNRSRAVVAVLIMLLSPVAFHAASSFAVSSPLTTLSGFISIGVTYQKILEGTDEKKGANLAREWSET